MSITTLYNFKFTSGSIFEIKFADLSDTAAKKDKFQWYLILDDHRHDLSFLKMTQTSRKFTYNNNIVDLDIDNKILKIHFENSQSISYQLS